jgi:hypothetical protein
MGGNFKDWRSWTKNAGDKVNNSTKEWGNNSKEFVEEIKVNSKNLVSEVERLLKESEVRRLRIRQGDRVLLDIPVAWAAIGALLAPPIAAVGAIAAVASDCVIEVTRVVPADAPAPRPQAQAAPASAPARPQEPAASRPNPNPGQTNNRPNNPDIPRTPDDLNYR